MSKYLLIIGILLFVFSSCSDERGAKIAEFEALELEIEKEQESKTNLNPAIEAKIRTLLTGYDEFVEQYPDDTGAAGYAYKVGLKYLDLSNPEEAIKAFDKVVDKFPDTKYGSEALFQTGWIYELYFQNINYARERYEIYKERYPQDAKEKQIDLQLKHLGDPDGLFEEVKKLNEALEAVD